MRRKSDRGKSKQLEPNQGEPPEKAKKSHRHSRRRKKSSSSSESESDSKQVCESIPQPLEVKDIELPQADLPPPLANATDKSSDEKKDISDDIKATQESNFVDSEEKEQVDSFWKVQSANGAGGSEIQKLKICRQRPSDSPEIGGESSVNKRLSRGNKDGRSTDDSAHEESEKDSKKSKRRTRNSSRSSPNVICDLSHESPTKIKIKNVSHISTENKIGNLSRADDVKDEQSKIACDVEDSQMSDTLDIALPSDEPQPKQVSELKQSPTTGPIRELPNSNIIEEPSNDANDIAPVLDDSKPCSPKNSTSPSPSPKNETLKLNPSGSSESEASDNEAKDKRKRSSAVLSSVQRKEDSPAPRRESVDSKDSEKKMEDSERESAEVSDRVIETSDKENEKDNPAQSTEKRSEEINGEQDSTQCPMPRKRRWGSSRSSRPEKKQIITISTQSLKSLLPDAKPVRPEELQLSAEEEEGQLVDEEEEDEVVALVTKEEVKEMELARVKEEKHKEKEKEVEEKKKRKERFERSTPEKKSPEIVKESSRKIHLLKENTKKGSRAQSPSRRKPTTVLYITNLVRPFTLLQLKNLLLRTGTIAENGFWIDKIKSKCYVEYTTEDAAVETRHALHGVRWPTSNPKTLVVEFASHDDLLMAQALAEEPDVPRKSEPLNMVEGWVAEQARIKERTRKTVVREWDVGKPEHPDEIMEIEYKEKEKKDQERKARKERPRRSATPEGPPPERKTRKKEDEAPAKLLDDLFRKTKASPCIYWLPLTQEQIAVKEEIRRQHMAEHERRMAELKKVDAARRDRERRSRK